MADPGRLAWFNGAARAEAAAAVAACLDVPRWVDALLDARPFTDTAAVCAAAMTAARPFTTAEVDRALSHHPRIGERPTGTTPEARYSRAEQAGLAGLSAGSTAADLAAGNRAYEERFDRVFLIRAAGRDAAEILAALHERLRNDDDTEMAVVEHELREIAALRLQQSLGPRARSCVTTHVLDTGRGCPAAGIGVRLLDGARTIATGSTGADGRVADLGPARLDAGTYQLSFDTGPYFDGLGTETFFPDVRIAFRVTDPDAHYHVPLLLSPFGFTTYRGS